MDWNTPLPVTEKPKRAARPTITWTPEMLHTLATKFATQFNRDLAVELGVGWRTVIRKARELGLQKEPGFLDKNRTEIVKRIAKVRKQNPAQTGKDFRIPNGAKFEFKKGHVSANYNNPELTARITATRNETIRRERIRRKYGMEPLTRLKLNV